MHAAEDEHRGERLPPDDRTRPHRQPDAEQASSALRAEVRAGRLDGDAVHAALKAAGHHAPARRTWPARLTAREVEVLGLLARGGH